MGTALSASCEDPSIVEPGTTADGGTTRPGIANLTSIKVLPESLSLTVNGTPQTQMFTARGTFLDGHQEDVTDRVAWSTSPTSLGGFSQGSILTLGAYGGEGLVIASSGNVQGSAKIRLRVSRRVVEMDARGADETKFGGKPDAKNPKLVYPYDKVMLPPNLGSIEVHWVRGNQAHTIYEVSLQNQVTDLKVYTGCRVPPGGDANGCVYALSQEIWGLLAYSNLGNRDAVVLTVRSTDGKTVGSADPANLKFANEDMKGGIYYWTAAENGQSVISRIDLEKGKVETYYATADSPTDHNGKKDCVGCHAIAHDGHQMALILGGAHVSDLVELDIEKRQPIFAKINTKGSTAVERQFANILAYGPDGQKMVAALRGKLRLISAANGADIIPQINTGGNATHPDWSDSGRYLAFTRYSDKLPPPDPDGDSHEIYISKGSIGLAGWNGVAFGDVRTLVPEATGENDYYPTVAPNDQYVVFNRVSGCATADACSAYSNPGARIFMIPIGQANAKAVELANINRRGPNDTRDELSNSWPKFGPFMQSTKEGRTVMWITFSSTRNYGVRLPNNADQPQLWMAAITVGGEPTTGDPSSAPLWIPYQNLATHNHIAQPTKQIVQTPQ